MSALRSMSMRRAARNMVFWHVRTNPRTLDEHKLRAALTCWHAAMAITTAMLSAESLSENVTNVASSEKQPLGFAGIVTCIYSTPSCQFGGRKELQPRSQIAPVQRPHELLIPPNVDLFTLDHHNPPLLLRCFPPPHVYAQPLSTPRRLRYVLVEPLQNLFLSDRFQGGGFLLPCVEHVPEPGYKQNDHQWQARRQTQTQGTQHNELNRMGIALVKSKGLLEPLPLLGGANAKF